VYGPIEDSDTILMGTILPVSGNSSTLGIPMEQAVTMAIEHFNSRGGVGPNSQKVAALLCDSGGEVSQGLEAAQHLESLGVIGVIGPAFSDVTIEVGSEYARPTTPGGEDGMVFISPSATNPAITFMLDEDRIWRVVPSDALQATAIAQLLTSPEAWNLPPNPSFVLVHKQGAYGRA
jgi:branched-chain amino acid transport system substrate-binding protein